MTFTISISISLLPGGPAINWNVFDSAGVSLANGTAISPTDALNQARVALRTSIIQISGNLNSISQAS